MPELDVCPVEELPSCAVKIVYAGSLAIGVYNLNGEYYGLEAIEQYEHELAADALDRLAELRWVKTYGPSADRRAGIISFNVENIHPHDVAQILDGEGIAIRAGHHCCQPLMTKLGVAATNRASFYLYTVPEEIDRLVDGIHKARRILG